MWALHTSKDISSFGKARFNVAKGRVTIRDQGSKIGEIIHKVYILIAHWRIRLRGKELPIRR